MLNVGLIDGMLYVFIYQMTVIQNLVPFLKHMHNVPVLNKLMLQIEIFRLSAVKINYLQVK